jgi:hypothetical protein
MSRVSDQARASKNTVCNDVSFKICVLNGIPEVSSAVVMV